MSYKEAMNELQSMFTGFDKETLNAVLSMNRGNLEKTIEDLLKMGDESSKNNQPTKNDDDDNLFANLTPAKLDIATNDNLFGIEDSSSGDGVENLGIFENIKPQPVILSPPQDNKDMDFARKLQQEEDEKLAMKLQEEYLRQSKQEAQGQKRPTNQNGHHDPNYGLDPQYYDEEDGSDREESEEEYEQHDLDGNPQPIEKKKKTSFTSKLKTAFGGLFKKKKKKTDATTTQASNTSQSTNSQPSSNSSRPMPSQANVSYPNKANIGQQNNNNTSNRVPENKPKNFDDGEQEIYNFSAEGIKHSRLGFHQYNGEGEKDHVLQLSDLNKNAYLGGGNNVNKETTTITSDYFNFN